MWYPCLESVNGSVSHSLTVFAMNEWNLYKPLHCSVVGICLFGAGRSLMLVSVIGEISMCSGVLNHKKQQIYDEQISRWKLHSLYYETCLDQD